MSFDALVLCRCFEDGLAVPPPVAVDRLVRTSFGWHLRDRDDHPAADVAVDRWRSRACAHPSMRAADEGLSKHALADLYYAITRHPPQTYPLLSAILHPRTDSATPSGDCGAALPELRALVDGLATVALPAVVDSDTGELVARYGPGRGGFGFVRRNREGDQWTVHVMRRGIRARGVSATETLRFRARRVEQRRVLGGYLWTDRDRGNSIKIPWVPIASPSPERGARAGPPRNLHVEQRPVRPSDFDGVIEGLARLFEASLATGNPVYWMG